MHKLEEINELTNLLQQLQEGKLEAVEYGEPGNPTGWLSGIRIKFMNTMGGHQFRICQLSRGMEGGGMYYPDISGAFEQASKLLAQYTKPIENPAIRKLLDSKPRSELKWFGIEKMPAPKGFKEFQPLFKDEQVITLKMEGN